MMRRTLIDQNMVANDDMAKDDMAEIWPRMKWRPVKTFNFFIAPNGLIGHLSRSPRYEHGKCSISAALTDDQPLFQALDQRLDRLEDDIAQNRKHILELITLLSGLDMAAKPARRNSASVKYLLRRNLYWFVIGFLVIGWGA